MDDELTLESLWAEKEEAGWITADKSRIMVTFEELEKLAWAAYERGTWDESWRHA